MSFDRLSPLVDSFAESATLALAGRAKEMQSQGKSVINFAVGEPDFATPTPIIEAACEEAKKGATKYTPVGGQEKVREALASRLTTDYGVSFTANQLMLSNGAKQAIFHFLQSILRVGDEVVIPRPYWTSFPEMVKMQGAKPVFLPASADTGLGDLDQLGSLMGEKTRLFILNSPTNPNGVVWDRALLQDLLKILKPYSTWILSDDTYYQLVYDPYQWASVLEVDPSVRERTCVVGSASKTYAMTGWRIGWASAPDHVLSAMKKLQGQVSSNPSSISQAALKAAVGSEHGSAQRLKDQFSKRRKFLLQLLEKGAWEFHAPQGAFYLFLKLCPPLKPADVAAFCKNLLEEHGVCVVPGEAFGEPEYVRLSYALDEGQLEEGWRRLESALKS